MTNVPAIMTQTPESGHTAKRRRRVEPSAPPWRAPDSSMHPHDALFVPPIDVTLSDPSMRPAAVVVPDEPAVQPAPHHPSHPAPNVPAEPIPLISPEAKDKLRAVLKSLEMDPRALTRIINMSTMLDERPSMKPGYALVRKIVAALSSLVYPSDPPTFLQLFDNRAQANASVQEKLISNIITAMKATKRGTIARRYVRSVLCGSMSRAEVNRLLGHDEDAPAHEEESDDGKEDTLKMTGKTFSRARRDWEVLIECGELQPAKYGRTKVQDESLRYLLAFLFSPENLVLVSWSALRIVVDEKTIQLPAVMVSKNGSLMHQEYCKALEPTTSNPLSRGSFYAVLNALTRKELKYPIPVDNATRTLVKDPLVLVRDLAIRFVPYEARSAFLREFDKAEWFLMHSFVESHLGTDDSGFHDINFALRGSTSLSGEETIRDKNSECKGCAFPFAVIDSLLKIAPPSETNAVKEITEACRQKFISYMCYLCRKTVQDKAVEDIFHDIRSNRMRNRLVIFVNFEHPHAPSLKAGKIPILQEAALHGAVVFFFEQGAEYEIGKDELKHVFYDHFISAESIEDTSIMTFVIEALLHRIRLDFPEANELIFVTDNTPVYKNQIFPCVLPYISRFHSFRAVRLLHSCSQICESLLDAHFEHVTKVLSRCCDGNSPTIEQALTIINSDDIFLDTAAGHVVLDRECQEHVKALRSQGSEISELRDGNDIIYQDWPAPEDGKAIENNMVKARIHDFGGIGQGSVLDIGDDLYQSLAQQRQAPMSELLHAAPENADVTPQVDGQGSAAGIGAPGFTIFTRYSGEVQKPMTIVDNGVSNSQHPGDIATTCYPIGVDMRHTTHPSTVVEWTGSVTQVRVLVIGRQINSRAIKLPPPPHGVTGGLLVDTISRIRSKKNNSVVSIEKHQKEEPSTTPLAKTGIAGRSCHECNRSFKSERFLQSHQCKGPPVDKDVSARAVVLATEMYRDRELPAFSDPSSYLWAGSHLTRGEEQQTISGLNYGWAEDIVLKDIVETNVMRVYKNEVFQWLDDCKGEAGLPASVFLDRLVGKYPRQGDLPSLQVIEAWCKLRKALWRIQPFCQMGHDGTPVMAYGEEADNGSGKSRMKARYIAKITEMHEHQLGLDEANRPKPRHMFKQFEEFFKDDQGRLPPDFPNQKQVINKINALRSKSKQRLEPR
ncbi:hypothetical protein FGB62_2g214 [Gracilaria domingensis]|nr:hypothetical protein FGB62_2g214 [Gracilaria domingensis]